MLLKDGRIFGSQGFIQGDILVEGEKIARVGKRIGVKGEKVVNLRGKAVLPGMVDAHVHLRDFRQKLKEDVSSGTRAALAGGVTSVMEMPNTDPAITSPGIMERRARLLERKACCDYTTYMGIVSNTPLEDIKLGKAYLDGTLGEVNDELLERAVVQVGRLSVHAESQRVIRENSRRFREHGKVRASEAEVGAVKKLASLAEKYGRKLHLCHLSSRDSLGYLNPYTSSEVTPHHLLLNSRHHKALGSIAKTNPPLRGPSDNRALWEALRTGKVDVIASDHAPHREEEKEEPNPPSGVPNLEVTLRLLLTMVNRGAISLPQVVKWYSENPSRLWGIEKKGSLEEGKNADILVLDMKKEGKIEPREFYSRARYSPFGGWKFKGEVERVYLRGKLAFEEGEVVSRPGGGKALMPEEKGL